MGTSRAAVVLACWLAVPGPLASGEVEKVRDTGPDANRLVVVLVAEGYTEAQRDEFRQDAAEALGALLAEPPYREYAPAINAYTDFVASLEAGADKPAPCFSPETLRDTAFDARYCTSGTERLLTVDAARVFSEVNQAVPSWDLIGVIVNDPQYGGAGGSVLTFSTHAAAGELFLHEAGHTFARLADEYETAFRPEKIDPEPNVELDFVFDDIKWNVWIDPATSLPTPETEDTLGAYEGARYHSEGIFRPVRDCKMRTLSRPFGAVCKEAHIQRLYQFVDPVDGEDPSAGTVEWAPCSPLALSLDLLRPDPDTLEVAWFLDGLELPGERGDTLVLDPSLLPEPEHQVRARVVDRTPQVRRTYWDLMEAERTWTVQRQVPFGDLDGDGVEDACDEDMDGDGVGNEVDCAPREAAVSDPPGPVWDLRVARTPGTGIVLTWSDVLGPQGGTEEGVYRAASGRVAHLREDGGFERSCVLEGTRSPALLDDRPGASAGVTWYVVQGVNACGPGPPGPGRPELEAEALPACP